MSHLQLTREEQGALTHALESYLADLHFEIARTDRPVMKQTLKDEEAMLRRLCNAIRPQEKVAA